MWPAWVAYALLLVAVTLGAVADLRTGRVFNTITYPAILVGVLWWSAAGFWFDGGTGALNGFIGSMTGLLVALILMLALLTLGLGGGDLKLMAAVGALSASWEVVLWTLFYAAVVACLWAVVVMVRRGLVRQTLAGMFNMLLMRSPDALPSSGRTVPFAVAIAVGAAVAGAESMGVSIFDW